MFPTRTMMRNRRLRILLLRTFVFFCIASLLYNFPCSREDVHGRTHKRTFLAPRHALPEPVPRFHEFFNKFTTANPTPNSSAKQKERERDKEKQEQRQRKRQKQKEKEKEKEPQQQDKTSLLYRLRSHFPQSKTPTTVAKPIKPLEKLVSHKYPPFPLIHQNTPAKPCASAPRNGPYNACFLRTNLPLPHLKDG